ncbi:MAG: class I SAM-dependent methyltransferase [archaeon]|nr:class I SAM-dependent methyltransferase [archaeon]MCP8321420.1 class I SAM-dependent methyltransferase [archaeon]
MKITLKEKLMRMSEREKRENQIKLLSIAEKEEGSRFLDIGCGDGKFTLEFATKIGAKEVYGVDIYEPALEEAKNKGIIIEKSDVNEGIHFPSEFFDVILCNQVAEHLLNPDTLFKEIRRLLRKQGHAYISVPNLCALHNRLFVLLGWQPTVIAPSTKFVFGNPARGAESNMWGPYRHLTAFSPAAFKEMLEFYGLRVKKYYGNGFYPFSGKISGLFSKLLPSFSVFQIAVAIKNAFQDVI